tara:strand:+ start:191755 stop:192294 length:540 start_codon:yes stop_codon:yes gene_type:complete
MLFHIGIKPPAQGETDYTFVVPVFDRINEPCTATWPTKEGLEDEAVFTLLAKAAKMLREGGQLTDLEDDYDAVQDHHKAYPECTNWLSLDIDMDTAISNSKLTQDYADQGYTMIKEAWDSLVADSGKPVHMFVATDKRATQFLAEFEMNRRLLLAIGLEVKPLVEGVTVNLSPSTESVH